MRHRVKGKKLNRSVPHRKALYRNLVSSLVKYGAIETTLAKARAVRPEAERVVTVARAGDLAARRRLYAYFYEKEVANKMLSDIAPNFKTRPGGYTRIIKLGTRGTDQSEMARLEFVSEAPSKASKSSDRNAEVKIKNDSNKKATK